jgi:hypothetical protein
MAEMNTIGPLTLTERAEKKKQRKRKGKAKKRQRFRKSMDGMQDNNSE